MKTVKEIISSRKRKTPVIIETCNRIESRSDPHWWISVCAVSNETGSLTMVMDKRSAIKKSEGCAEKEKIEGSVNIREDQTMWVIEGGRGSTFGKWSLLRPPLPHLRHSPSPLTVLREFATGAVTHN